MSIDLHSLSLKELKDLQSQVVRAIASFEDRVKRAALTEIEELARAKGFNLSELMGLQAPRKRTPATAKFANPADASDTWSGRGRKPRWFVAAIAAGKSPDDLAI
jgi:DNA-binding protein H-NS